MFLFLECYKNSVSKGVTILLGQPVLIEPDTSIVIYLLDVIIRGLLYAYGSQKPTMMTNQDRAAEIAHIDRSDGVYIETPSFSETFNNEEEEEKVFQ